MEPAKAKSVDKRLAYNLDNSACWAAPRRGLGVVDFGWYSTFTPKLCALGRPRYILDIAYKASQGGSVQGLRNIHYSMLKLLVGLHSYPVKILMCQLFPQVIWHCHKTISCHVNSTFFPIFLSSEFILHFNIIELIASFSDVMRKCETLMTACGITWGHIKCKKGNIV